VKQQVPSIKACGLTFVDIQTALNQKVYKEIHERIKEKYSHIFDLDQLRKTLEDGDGENISDLTPMCIYLIVEQLSQDAYMLSAFNPGKRLKRETHLMQRCFQWMLDYPLSTKDVEEGCFYEVQNFFPEFFRKDTVALILETEEGKVPYLVEEGQVTIPINPDVCRYRKIK
jgi:hypothetical protein